MPTNRCSNFCDLFLTYIYLMWDGLVFFGYDDNKLQRLKGIKPRWYDRFLNKRWLFFNMTFAIILSIVLMTQLQTLGQVRAQEKQSENLNEYIFKANKFFKLTAKLRINLGQLLKIMDKSKKKKVKTLSDYNKIDPHKFTSNETEEIEEFICSNNYFRYTKWTKL